MARLRDDDRGGRRGGFKYKERDADSVRKRAQQSGGLFDSILKDGVARYAPQRGDNRVRFLPPTFEDAEHYGLDVWVHYGIGTDRGSYLCLKKMKNKPCPICDAVAEMKADGEADEAKRIDAKKRVLVYLIDRKERDQEPKVWAMPWTVDRDIANAAADDEDGEVLQVDRPERGYDVSFRIEGQKRNTKYIGVKVSRKPSPLSDDKKEMQEWLDKIQEEPLDTLLAFKKADELQEIIDGHVPNSEDEDDDGDRKSKRRDKDDEDEDDAPRGRRKPRDDDDDDDDEDSDRKPKRRSRASDDDDDDDEDETPPRKRGSSRASDDDDDDGDDSTSRKRSRSRASDDDEDEEDDGDRKRVKRSRASDDDEDDGDDEDEDEDDDDDGDRRTSRRRR